MASPPQALLLLTILLPLLTLTTAARPFHIHPCKTILFISTTSSNPNFSPQNPSSQYITFFFTNIREPKPNPNPNPNPNHSLRSFDNPIFFDRAEMEAQHPQLPASSSFRDRTLDIMSVVGALLFGVGCGALTAATMYLIWSMFSPNNDYDYDEGNDNDYDDAIASPKKMGYVAIPAVTTAVPPPAKEVV